MHKTGTHPSLEKLRKEIPAGVLEMLTVPGLRPEKVLRLYNDLGVTSLAELETAAKEDRIKRAKGLGAALQTKILQNLAIAKSGGGRCTCIALRLCLSTRRPRCAAPGPSLSG